jgi:hypothetical protein
MKWMKGGDVVNDILILMLWQVVLIGGVVVSRRLRRLERAARPPCYAQVGALREQVVALRSEHDVESEEHARAEDEFLAVLQRQQQLHVDLLRRIEGIEQLLDARALVPPGPRLAGSGS